MIKNKCILLVIIAQSVITLQLSADHVITFFIRPYPHVDQKTDNKSLLKKIGRPGKVAKYHLKKLIKSMPATGIFCTYAGFLATSNGIGQVTFPRRHTDPELSIIITNRIEPMLMAANTIHHWSIQPNEPVKQYNATRTTDDDTGLTYWNVSMVDPPENRILPAQSILIFAKPKNFYIPEGTSLTSDSANLVLPTVYARRETDIATNALIVLALRQFFDSISSKRTLSGKMYQVHEAY